LVYWFTFPPAEMVAKGLAPEQAWLVGVGEFHEDTIQFDNIVMTRGPVFGDDFDSDLIAFDTWGSLSMQFDDSNSGSVSYVGPENWGTGTLPLERITNLDGLDPAPAKQRPNLEASKGTSDGVVFSGSWFDPSHDGEGWLIEILPGNVALVYWFSYDGNGNQAWFLGIGSIEGNNISIDDGLISSGTRFGADFDSDAITLDDWGSMSFSFDDCDTGTMSYSSGLAEYGSGSLQLARLTSIPGLECVNSN
jgi:hypothetical protein